MAEQTQATELITSAECARRLGVSKTMVTKYVRGGMPRDEQGRIAWPDCKLWVERYISPTRSGNPSGKRREEPIAEPDDPYSLGLLHGWGLARTRLRAGLQEILPRAEGLDLNVRIFFLAIMDSLMAEGIDSPSDCQSPPAIDWTEFRNEQPAELQRFFDGAQVWCRTGEFIDEVGG
jgi:hypothetical protein